MGSESRYRIPFPKRLPAVLMVGVVALLIAHVSTQILHFRGYEDPFELHLFFNVDDEPSVPTWYSAAMLIVSSGLLLAIAGARKRDKDRDARYWYGLSIGFAFLSLDEIAGIHETFNTLSDMEWTIPAAFLVAVVGILFLRFLWRLPARSRNRFLFAAAVFLGGALGVEYLTGRSRVSLDSLDYAYWTMVEEGMEMTGAVMFIAGLLDYMRADGGNAAVQLDARTSARARE